MKTRWSQDEPLHGDSRAIRLIEKLMRSGGKFRMAAQFYSADLTVATGIDARTGIPHAGAARTRPEHS